MIAESELDPYTLLGVSREAPQVVVDAAYKALMRGCHPDHAVDAADRQLREQRAQLLGEARAILSDPLARRRLDEDLGHEGFGGMDEGDRSDESAEGCRIVSGHLRRGEFRLALSLVEKLLDQNAADPELLRLRAAALVLLATETPRPPNFDVANALSLAELDAAAAVALNPASLAARETLAHVYLEQGSLQAAVEVLEAVEPTLSQSGRHLLAWALVRQVERRRRLGRLGASDDAKLRRAARLDPTILR